MVLSRFNDVLFGIVCLYGNQILGGKMCRREEYNTSTMNELSHGLCGRPVNFRTLLLSCFNPHGGAPHVVYVEISRDSAADILTVRRFLRLVEEFVKPGTDGSPRYVVISGDQPSYKFFVEIWLESWRKARAS